MASGLKAILTTIDSAARDHKKMADILKCIMGIDCKSSGKNDALEEINTSIARIKSLELTVLSAAKHTSTETNTEKYWEEYIIVVVAACIAYAQGTSKKPLDNPLVSSIYNSRVLELAKAIYISTSKETPEDNKEAAAQNLIDCLEKMGITYGKLKK